MECNYYNHMGEYCCFLRGSLRFGIVEKLNMKHPINTDACYHERMFVCADVENVQIFSCFFPFFLFEEVTEKVYIITGILYAYDMRSVVTYHLVCRTYIILCYI